MTPFCVLFPGVAGCTFLWLAFFYVLTGLIATLHYDDTFSDKFSMKYAVDTI